MQPSSSIGHRIQTPAQATEALDQLADCLALQGYSIHLYACSMPLQDCFLVASDDSSIHPLALDELGPALATSTFQTLLLAVNSTGPPVVGWLSGSCTDSGTRLQHVWADDAAPEWFYYDAEAAHTCSVQRALLDVFRLLLWRSHLEGLLAESSCLVFRPSEADAPPFEHLAEAPLMLATGTRA